MPWMIVQALCLVVLTAQPMVSSGSSVLHSQQSHHFPPQHSLCTFSTTCVYSAAPTGNIRAYSHSSPQGTFIHPQFDNRCSIFQHRVCVIDPRYLKHFCGICPFGFPAGWTRIYIFNATQLPWDSIAPEKCQWNNQPRKWRLIKWSDLSNVTQETDVFSGIGPDPSSLLLRRSNLTSLYYICPLLVTITSKA